MNEWIPCKERMPEHGGDYLVTYLEDGCCDHLTVGIEDLWISETGKHKSYSWATIPNENVIAWMELPEPYPYIEEE